MKKDELLKLKTDFLKILSKNEDFSILTSGKDGNKNTLNLMVTSLFAQSCFFDGFLAKYFFMFFDTFFDCHFFWVAATKWSLLYDYN